MDLHAVKQKLQGHFTDGLVIIVGCGLSSAEGIPGMWALGEHLKVEIPRVAVKDTSLWNKIKEALDSGKTIEQALIEFAPTAELEEKILDVTAQFIFEAELKIFNEVIQGCRVLRFTKLLEHILRTNSGIPIITTNYDRLIELACEMAGLGVDTLFSGQFFGKLDEKASRMSFCREVTKKAKAICLKFADRVVIMKPHGSLDWYLCNDTPIRCPLPLSLPRLIITPGWNKFRGGYDRPFDNHREKANRCIDSAARYLIIGYGFNDDHLETHLSPNLKNGKPALILTQTLSDNAAKLLRQCDQIMAVTGGTDPGIQGARFRHKRVDLFFPGPILWDLEVFIQEVLEP